MRILVIDDDYVSRTKLKKILMGYGDCDTAPNGEIGLGMFECAYTENMPYDLITVDIDMPVMPGQQVVKKIRSSEKDKNISDGAGAKVLMVTVMKDAHNVATSYYEGCQGYIAKPITQESVGNALTEMGLKK